jgi:hypothetical protein
MLAQQNQLYQELVALPPIHDLHPHHRFRWVCFMHQPQAGCNARLGRIGM